MDAKPEWLEETGSIAEERHFEQEMSDDEYEFLTAIVKQTRAGKWAEGEEQVIEWMKSRRPKQYAD